jgi:hypothetical protein
VDAGDRQALLQNLEQGQQELLEALRGVSEDLVVRIPAPGSWSVLQCIEHVAVSEGYLFERLTVSRALGSPKVDEPREESIVVRGLDRTKNVRSPDAAEPTVLRPLPMRSGTFRASRDRTIQFVRNCNEDLRAKVTDHPLIGVLNCHELLLIMSVHPRRHARQVEEVRSALSDPDK